MGTNAVLVAVVVCNTFILAGTAYIVFGLGHSGWWFLLAVLLLDTVKRKPTGEKGGK